MSEQNEKCNRCDGCGKIANSEDGEPWTVWTSLPLHSSAAVLAGIVRPITCPDCNGTGKTVSDEPIGRHWPSGDEMQLPVSRAVYNEMLDALKQVRYSLPSREQREFIAALIDRAGRT